jgi:hypothetical protein
MKIFPKNFILLTIISIFLPISAYADVERLYRQFTGSMSEKELARGSYISHSTDFYSILLDNKIDTRTARIVILIKPDFKESPLEPAREKMTFQLKGYWPYHSFLIFEGKVYDPAYCRPGADLADYFADFWNKDRQREQIQVYSFQLKHVPIFMGFKKPGGSPKLAGFLPVSIEELLKNPQHVSRSRK